MKINELTTDEQMKTAFPLMNQLRPQLTKDVYLDLLADMKRQGYRMFGGYIDEKLVVLAGVIPLANLYYERHLWVYDLVTDQHVRSKGYGEKLLAYLHTWAAEQGLGAVALSSGLQRTDAHRFYEEKMDYDKVSYVFKKNL
ncbi:GNAT family N-acetyltransferase [Bacillus tianshenii]|nr:GNAT family N-acetyltransferase [Bacillus tianshenii]